MFEKPIRAIVKLASLSVIPTSPIISGRYMYGKYWVKSPNKFATHKRANSGFLKGEWNMVVLINVVIEVDIHFIVLEKSSASSLSFVIKFLSWSETL